ncbi:GtrA family protein [Cohnella endophytica]|uniref:GtrA family protein n=1 Tax=Cohnella endophytica TaxID=2419778 RepID=A0A494Y053_9BACL|nr:GtrA family protein [Cohnella endophytica]RKP56149.1 GtrA family protein [Cohnella endophytica]
MLRLSEGKKLAKYALVGGLNTGVDFAVFCTLVYAVGMGSFGAQTISYVAGVVNSYLLNRYWTFQVKGKKSMAELARFILINVLSFAAATAVLLGLEWFGMESAFAKIGSVFCSLAVNYAGYRLWVFQGMEQPGKRAH